MVSSTILSPGRLDAPPQACPVGATVRYPRSERVGWQPSRYLADRAEAERAFQLAEQLGSVNAAAQELGTTWPSLRKAFQRHGLGMPARNPEAIRQRAIAPAHKRTGQAATPPLDPVFLALNPGALPARERSPAASSTSGSAATSSTPPWGPTWWWGCTAKATRVDQPPGPGRSSAAPTAPTGWPANAPAAPNAAVPIA